MNIMFDKVVTVKDVDIECYVYAELEKCDYGVPGSPEWVGVEITSVKPYGPRKGKELVDSLSNRQIILLREAALDYVGAL